MKFCHKCCPALLALCVECRIGAVAAFNRRPRRSHAPHRCHARAPGWPLVRIAGRGHVWSTGTSWQLMGGAAGTWRQRRPADNHERRCPPCQAVPSCACFAQTLFNPRPCQ